MSPTEPNQKETQAEAVIEVESLTKRYGRHAAVRDVSFSVRRGEIVGLLGPNGAGKSTILRIVACYMPGSSGTVRIAGLDAFREADEARRRIGYMPEHNPLYGDMRVREYLRFRGRIKGLSGKRLRARIEAVVELCSLEEAFPRIIATLSKGYRQRVGLADALLHEPEVLILDEPSIGLDPRQIRSFRRLIRSLGGRHTIVLSSHILPEVELTCGRVLIVHHGRLLEADEKRGEERQVCVEARAPADLLAKTLEAIPGVGAVQTDELGDGYCRCRLDLQPGADPRTTIFELAAANDWKLRELRLRKPSLEDLFIQATAGAQETDTEEQAA
ncbi:MAG: ATP-binding cassette domain-containing protein [Verrucomicrobia bacterium]|nr:ATP-binding cassette domain-containing protein [Verrucomicrobiota bacterium]